MSVIGQPTSTPTASGVMPAAFNVSIVSRNSSHVSGGSTPASSKDATLYQTVDLLAPLNMIPYWVPSMAPTSATGSPNASTIGSRRSSSGWIAPCSANWAMSPGWPMAAISGGLPPSTALERSGARLSPPDVYFTVTFGYSSLKLSMTAWNDSCSSPPQMAMIEMFPVTSSLPSAPPPPPSPPQPAATKASIPTKSPRTIHRFLIAPSRGLTALSSS